MPGHANEERAVVAVVGGPPLLRIGHQSNEIGLDRGEVEGFEFRRVVEVVSHRAGPGCAVGKDPQIQVVGPPVLVLLADTHGSVVDRALAFGCHRWLSYRWCFSVVGNGVLGRAGRASTPVDDLGFVDDESLIVCCGQAGGVADGAIDIGEVAAGAADHMVMVVAGTCFVSGGRAGGLYPAKKSVLGENRERVIDRLTRDRADSAANIVHNNVGRGMG